MEKLILFTDVTMLAVLISWDLFCLRYILPMQPLLA